MIKLDQFLVWVGITKKGVGITKNWVGITKNWVGITKKGVGIFKGLKYKLINKLIIN